MAFTEHPSPDLTPPVEVAEYPVHCIASNIRPQKDILWSTVHPIIGQGYEGNLVLAEVTEVNARQNMEYLIHGHEGIDVPLIPGKYIVGVLANRHSGTSEFGEVPPEGIPIEIGTELDLLAVGGVMGRCLGVPKSLGTKPTKLRTIGLLAHPTGEPIHLTDLFAPWDSELGTSAPIILSCGTAAEIGKTTTARELIRTFKSKGFQRVGAAKIAGTGRGRDILNMERAGGNPAYDFPDVGLATTYTSPERYIPAVTTLLNKLNAHAPDIILAECGGDIIEGNIPTLLTNPATRGAIKAIVHSSTDALSIIGSLLFYEKWGILGKIPVYLTYPYQRNFYAIKERLHMEGIDLPMFDPLNQEETQMVVQDMLRKMT